MDIQIREAQKTPSKINLKKDTKGTPNQIVQSSRQESHQCQNLL